jgi:Sds3-like
VIGICPLLNGIDGRIFAERSAEIVAEQTLVTTNQHPEIQKLFVDLENNRAERIRRAKVGRKYRLQEIKRKYDVESEIVKRQFLSDRAMVRETLISELTAQWFQIHREKRTMDMCVPGTPFAECY